jgi:Flp pilus assembly protein TadD
MISQIQNRKILLFVYISIIIVAVVTAAIFFFHYKYYSKNAIVKQANLLLESGDYLGARKRYKKVINRDPENFSAHFGLGLSYCAETIFKTDLGMAKTEDWHPAIYHMTIAMNLNENDQVKKTLAILHFNLGTFFKKENNLEAAIESIRQAVAYDPTLLKALNLLGAMYHERGNLEEAEYYYKKSIAVKPDYAMAHFNLGAIAWVRKDFEAAVSYFQKAASLDPENTYFQNWLVKAEKHAGE